MKLFSKKYWWLVLLAVTGYVGYTYFTYIVVMNLPDDSLKKYSWAIALLGFVITDLWGAIAVAHGYYIGREPAPIQMSPVEYRCISGTASLKDRFIVGLMDFLCGFISIGRIMTALINMSICFGIAKLLTLIF